MSVITDVPLRRPADPAVLRGGLLALVLVTAPLTVILGREGSRPTGSDFDTAAYLFASDLALVALVVAAGPMAAIGAARRRLGWPTTALGLLAVLFIAALAVHPSWRGAITVFRVAGAFTIAAVVAELRESSAWRAVLVAVVGAQAVIAAAQVIVGGAVGLAAVGEMTDPFVPIGVATRAPSGTLPHPYVLAGLALVGAGVATVWAVARRSWLWAAGAAIVIAPVAFTYSRAAAIGAAALCIVFVASALMRVAGFLSVALAVTVTLAIGVGLGRDGWAGRVSQTTGATTEATLTTERGNLAGQALDMIEERPVFGVGPGRYVASLPPPIEVRKPVHNVALLVAAEAGVLAGVTFAGLVVALGLVAARRGRAELAAWLAFVPLLLLDHFAYTFPVGLVMTGVWVGALDNSTHSTHSG